MTDNQLAVADVRTVTAAIKRARERRTMTQKQLADAVGVSQVLVHHVENGSQFPPPLKLAKLLRAVGLRLTAVEVDQ